MGGPTSEPVQELERYSEDGRHNIMKLDHSRQDIACLSSHEHTVSPLTFVSASGLRRKTRKKSSSPGIASRYGRLG